MTEVVYGLYITAEGCCVRVFYPFTEMGICVNLRVEPSGHVCGFDHVCGFGVSSGGSSGAPSVMLCFLGSTLSRASNVIFCLGVPLISNPFGFYLSVAVAVGLRAAIERDS